MRKPINSYKKKYLLSIQPHVLYGILPKKAAGNMFLITSYKLCYNILDLQDIIRIVPVLNSICRNIPGTWSFSPVARRCLSAAVHDDRHGDHVIYWPSRGSLSTHQAPMVPISGYPGNRYKEGVSPGYTGETWV